MKQCAKEEKENVIISPFSIIMLLAIAADASSGKTKNEIANVLSESMPFEEVRDILCDIQKLLEDKKTFSSANALCVHHAIEKHILPDFITNLQNRFNGEFFASENLVQDVNIWTKEKTNGLIPQIMNEPISDETVACLLNAVSFKSDWYTEFDEKLILPERFTNLDNLVKEIPMLHSTEKYYIEDNYFTGFVKPYQADYSFMALLPKEEGESFLMRSLTQVDYVSLYLNKIRADVKIAMPEFSYSFEKELTGICQMLGIHTVFTDNADFSPVTDVNIKAGSVLHKARIELDRKGTKAAAVTRMNHFLTASACVFQHEPRIVYLTRPFIYAIIHNETCLPVFTGVLNRVK